MREPRPTWGYVWCCRYCGKPCRGYTPRHGDGSVQLLYPHTNKKGVRCANDRSDHYFEGTDGEPSAGPGN